MDVRMWPFKRREVARMRDVRDDTPGGIVRITWTDAVYANEIEDGTTLTPMLCVAAGHLIYLSDEHVTIAMEEFDDGSYRRLLSIPQDMVHDITYLRE